jgi:tetratricopeptide (TPR) repeat protein
LEYHQWQVLQRLHHIIFIAAVLLVTASARADVVNLYGKVVMEDGSPPGHLVGIQRKCGADVPVREANASGKTGVYFVHLYVSDYGGVFSGGYQDRGTRVCYLEAVMPGYTSTRLDLSDRHIVINPQLPNLVLSKQGTGALVEISESTIVPRAAKKSWEQALKYLTAKNWAAAEISLRAVVEAAPGFAPAWASLGAACQNQQKPAEARKALERAIELEPKRLPLYLALAAVESHLKDWPAALKTSEALIKADNTHIYLEAYLHNAVARYQQKDFDGALERLNKLVQLDKRQELPRAEYILGIVLEAKGELDAAAAHMRKYLADHPRAKDAGTVADRLANLGKQPGADLGSEVHTADLQIAAAGEARVPGGIKAFSAIARIPGAPTYQDFFLQYCRAILNGSVTVASPTAEVNEAIRTFVSTMDEFEQLGERSGDRITIRLAVDTKEHREKTARALALLGWRLRESGQDYEMELGDQAIDEARQRIPAAFGIDELEMRDAVVRRRPFQFEIPIEKARLVGGAAWTATLRDRRQAALGPVDIFLHDWRFAHAYAGLAAMDNETAAAVVSAVGLVPLITNYSGLLDEYGEALSLSGEHVVVPGGVKAEPVWARLAGANPKNAPSFFRALFEKDNGAMLTFFFDLSRADAAHQQYFSAPPGRGDAFCMW